MSETYHILKTTSIANKTINTQGYFVFWTVHFQ